MPDTCPACKTDELYGDVCTHCGYDDREFAKRHSTKRNRPMSDQEIRELDEALQASTDHSYDIE